MTWRTLLQSVVLCRVSGILRLTVLFVSNRRSCAARSFQATYYARARNADWSFWTRNRTIPVLAAIYGDDYFLGERSAEATARRSKMKSRHGGFVYR